MSSVDIGIYSDDVDITKVEASHLFMDCKEDWFISYDCGARLVACYSVEFE